MLFLTLKVVYNGFSIHATPEIWACTQACADEIETANKEDKIRNNCYLNSQAIQGVSKNRIHFKGVK